MLWVALIIRTAGTKRNAVGEGRKKLPNVSGGWPSDSVDRMEVNDPVSVRTDNLTCLGKRHLVAIGSNSECQNWRRQGRGPRRQGARRRCGPGRPGTAYERWKKTPDYQEWRNRGLRCRRRPCRKHSGTRSSGNENLLRLERSTSRRRY